MRNKDTVLLVEAYQRVYEELESKIVSLAHYNWAKNLRKGDAVSITRTDGKGEIIGALQNWEGEFRAYEDKQGNLLGGVVPTCHFDFTNDEGQRERGQVPGTRIHPRSNTSFTNKGDKDVNDSQALTKVLNNFGPAIVANSEQSS